MSRQRALFPAEKVIQEFLCKGAGVARRACFSEVGIQMPLDVGRHLQDAERRCVCYTSLMPKVAQVQFFFAAAVPKCAFRIHINTVRVQIQFRTIIIYDLDPDDRSVFSTLLGRAVQMLHPGQHIRISISTF